VLSFPASLVKPFAGAVQAEGAKIFMKPHVKAHLVVKKNFISLFLKFLKGLFGSGLNALLYVQARFAGRDMNLDLEFGVHPILPRKL